MAKAGRTGGSGRALRGGDFDNRDGTEGVEKEERRKEGEGEATWFGAPP